MNGVIPKKEQLDFLDWELGVFFHFGIRTFFEGHKDWDLKEMSISAFNPTRLDCESWLKTIKEAGANYAIFVCKHHDGFCNWPSKYTNYSVANTPWKDGKGDVVREFVDACRKYDMRVGLYYSPAEFGSNTKNGKEYDDYFVNQISELLSNYGKIDYLWFDGCGSEDHEYDTVRIVKAIRELQPNILLFNMWDPDTRWVGNESGVAHYPNFNVVNSLDFSVQTDMKDNLGEYRFLPVECDCRIRYSNWFYSENDEHTLKSVDELMGIYYYSVGRGANLLINIAPDRNGLLTEADSNRFTEFGNEIKRRFCSPINNVTINHIENIYQLQFSENKLVNHLIIEENIENCENVQKFKVLAYPTEYGAPITIFNGFTIGHKLIIEFATINTSKLEIIIEETNQKEKLKKASAYLCCK